MASVELAWAALFGGRPAPTRLMRPRATGFPPLGRGNAAYKQSGSQVTVTKALVNCST
jgi:hypothetical protein